MGEPHQQFRPGKRVRLSIQGLKILTHLKSDTRGTLVGKGVLGKDYIRVLRDGYKTPETYAVVFWELDG